jgi:hypothetical protein
MPLVASKTRKGQGFSDFPAKHERRKPAGNKAGRPPFQNITSVPCRNRPPRHTRTALNKRVFKIRCRNPGKTVIVYNKFSTLGIHGTGTRTELVHPLP